MELRPILAALWILLLASAANSQPVPRRECFPIERLPASLRARAEETLLALLDSEALYTVVGGVKPISSGFVRLSLKVAAPDTRALNELQQILSALRCGGDLRCELLPFHALYDGTRFVEGAVFYRPAVARTVAAHPEFFAPFGLAPDSDPLAIALLIEHDATTARNRGLGYLYGFPRYAVDFFVRAADDEERTRQRVPRDFVQIPTAAADTGRFVYAVPKGHTPRTEDIALKEAAALILAEYRARRERYIGPGKPGVVALLRDWFDDGTGLCAPAHARFGAGIAPR